MEQSEFDKTLRLASQSMEVLERMYSSDPAVQTLAVAARDLVACVKALAERVEVLEQAR
jgi:hypothetical protein